MNGTRFPRLGARETDSVRVRRRMLDAQLAKLAVDDPQVRLLKTITEIQRLVIPREEVEP